MRRIFERIIEFFLTVSGAITSIVILLMVIFLFKEGFGFFQNSAVEKGYTLCVNSENTVNQLTSLEIKQIFDYEIENWKDLGGREEEIVPFRFDEIFNRYSEEELGENYEFLPEKLGEVIAETSGIIAFIPAQYLPKNQPNAKILNNEQLNPADFFGGTEWMPTATPSPQFGLLPLLLGTLWVSLLAILIALPLGLGVAIYLSELAGKRMRRLLKPAIELLAGIPSVVYGFFGLVVLAPLLQKILHLSVGETAFTGSLVLAIMALPTIITIAEDAMQNTPQAMREASLGLGANHWQTIYKVIIPYSASGISAAVVLGIGRAIGETMAVLMVTGNAAVIPHSFFEPVRTIPATIAAELGEAPVGGAHYQALFMLGCILFIITMIISVAAEGISKKGIQKKGI
ncbi:phosphate transport system permease protein [Bacteroidia bacterium]|nr:phosphate transport system permease protein [Bacteroidia bacterium]GHV08065.1 phosphate transport system permease protein [Bacteroidia bacterium]